MLAVLAFYLFSGVLLLSAGAVICVRNPVYAVLFLILAFFNASGLFVLMGAEFLAFILAIVYVGAVAVLFLFVVMMLDIGPADLRRGALRAIPVGLAVGALLLAELSVLYSTWRVPVVKPDGAATPESPLTNTEALGRVLYTDYLYAFQIAGLILLVAMIGAIVLTHRVRHDSRRQSVADQNARKASDVLEIVKVKPGAGI
ncbi:MAG TPA: NADH-quinone oxidoreductase subunit J [Alphaproteobacteria bacterium]|nr:NADH-quinone oxidoreductase subunit J [Alphaproteobacteria bacterium]